MVSFCYKLRFPFYFSSFILKRDFVILVKIISEKSQWMSHFALPNFSGFFHDFWALWYLIKTIFHIEVGNSKKNSIASVSKHENLRFVTVLVQNAQSFIAVLFPDKSLVSCCSWSLWCVGAIWYRLHNLKNVKEILEGVLLLVKFQAKACNFTKSNTPPWVFYFFKIDTKSRNALFRNLKVVLSSCVCMYVSLFVFGKGGLGHVWNHKSTWGYLSICLRGEGS